MKNLTFIANTDSVTVIQNGQPTTVRRGQPNYLRLKDALVNGRFELASDLLNMRTLTSKFSNGLIEIRNGDILYKGRSLHGVISNTLFNLLSDGVSDASPLLKMLEKLLQNPDSNSVKQAYDFYLSAGLSICDDGDVLAWKGVKSDFYSVMGNTSTVVLSGEVNSGGCILNKIGSVIEVERFSVDSDRNNTCSHGLHVGAKAYADAWGALTLLTKHNPKDVVAVPQDCDCQKMRLSRYEILEQVSRGNNNSVTFGYASNSKKKNLSTQELESRIKAICSEKGLNITSDLDILDLPDYIADNFDNSDYWKVINSLRDAARDNAGQNAVREKVINCILRYLPKKVPTLREIHSNLKIKGLTCESISGIAKEEGFHVISSDPFCQSLIT